MTKLDKNREIPKFLLDKRYLLGSVLFVLTFSFMFMAIYSPFSMTAWFSITDTEKIGTTVSFYMVAFFAFTEIITWILSFNLIMWCVTFIDL